MRFFKIIGAAMGGLLLLGIVGSVALFISTAGEYEVPATVSDDPTLPRVELDGYAFHAETFGNAANPVVVVVHGGPGGNYGYLLNLHRLADEYFVVFYDQRGAGLSPRVAASELSLASSITDLHGIVMHFGQGEPVRLIGHSWGAMLVAGYLGQHPEMAARAVLAEPGALDNAGLARFRERQGSTLGLAYYRQLVPAIFEGVHADRPDAEANSDYVFGKMSAHFVNSEASGYRCEDARVTRVEPGVPVPPDRFGATAFNALFGEAADLTPIAANAANYPDEVLFLASACNTFLGEAFQREQMRLFPQARLAIIPDAGHEMFSDNPAESLRVVRAYLSE